MTVPVAAQAAGEAEDQADAVEDQEDTDAVEDSEDVLAAHDADLETQLQAEARARFELGHTLYQQGRFVEAAVEFQRAHELSSRPGLLYNLYLAYRDAGRTADAASHLRRYLAEEAEIPNRRMLVTRLQVLESQVARERAAEASRARAEADRAAAEQRALDAERRASGPSLVGPAMTMVAGAAALVAGGGLGLGNRGLYDDIESRCFEGPTCPGSAREDIDSLHTRNLVADVLLGVGGAAVAAGLVWLIVRLSGGDEDTVARCDAGACAEARF